jgi:hypothetical protein
MSGCLHGNPAGLAVSTVGADRALVGRWSGAGRARRGLQIDFEEFKSFYRELLVKDMVRGPSHSPRKAQGAASIEGTLTGRTGRTPRAAVQSARSPRAARPARAELCVATAALGARGQRVNVCRKWGALR